MTTTTRARVLIVDGVAILRSSIRRMLTNDFDVDESPDGAHAFDRIAAGDRFDLVLMDLEMPRMNGRDALRRMGEIAPELAARTVIMSGGNSDPELRTWLTSLGPRRLLPKPFSKALLLETLRACLEPESQAP